MPTTRIAVLVAALSAAASPATAQTAERAQSYDLLLSGGLSNASRSVDSRGWHGEAALAHPLSRRVTARLEVTTHVYDAVPVYPCLVRDAQRCYQTLGRNVTAGIANLAYQPVAARDSGLYRSFYLIGGLGWYGSRRIATAYPDCEITGVCTDRDVHTMTLRDSQLGMNGGVGVNLMAGRSSFFIETRVHFARRSSPEGTPSNDYFLMPVSLGFRL